MSRLTYFLIVCLCFLFFFLFIKVVMARADDRCLILSQIVGNAQVFRNSGIDKQSVEQEVLKESSMAHVQDTVSPLLLITVDIIYRFPPSDAMQSQMAFYRGCVEGILKGLK